MDFLQIIKYLLIFVRKDQYMKVCEKIMKNMDMEFYNGM